VSFITNLNSSTAQEIVNWVSTADECVQQLGRVGIVGPHDVLKSTMRLRGRRHGQHYSDTRPWLIAAAVQYASTLLRLMSVGVLSR